MLQSEDSSCFALWGSSASMHMIRCFHGSRRPYIKEHDNAVVNLIQQSMRLSIIEEKTVIGAYCHCHEHSPVSYSKRCKGDAPCQYRFQEIGTPNDTDEGTPLVLLYEYRHCQFSRCLSSQQQQYKPGHRISYHVESQLPTGLG